jgi:dolichol-phosphate mannosyltransferase
MLRLDVRDLTAGYRAYRGEILGRIDIEAVRAEGYGFQVEMTYFVAQLGGRIVEIPIKFVDRVRGTSKMSSNIVVEAMALVTWWGIRDRVRGRRP